GPRGGRRLSHAVQPDYRGGGGGQGDGADLGDVDGARDGLRGGGGCDGGVLREGEEREGDGEEEVGELHLDDCFGYVSITRAWPSCGGTCSQCYGDTAGGSGDTGDTAGEFISVAICRIESELE
ncbi:hypothetical protein V495_04409, partial [Pseudogymnoascus sp. VKM F-4514 (FW-929)]